ncbi:MAG: serine/threonine-protein kinase RsbW [Rhodobacteraceae bacterium HLUCCA12]|nr:MAG: serine/threonine-protein kinase RsbW [Rhodobacteraceae bacterium HLUCCA12]
MAVCDSLRKAGLNEDDLGSAELVLAEVLNNIVEHAYCRRSGHVEMTVTLRPDGLYCEVRDHGDHMPQGRPPNLPPPRIDPPRQLPEGGFGWHIIRSLTTHLGYRQQDGWNALSFVMPLTGFD